jgi:peptide/nickel transport system permease protein
MSSRQIPLEDPGLIGDRDALESRHGTMWRLLKSRRSAIAGGAILAFFVLVGLFSGILEPYDVTQQVGPVFGHPNSHHLLGLDDSGYDMISLLIEGTKVSLIVGFAATLVSMVIGGGIGVAAGYYGGGTDTLLMRITDYFLVIPDIPLMMVLAALFGSSLFNIVFVIGIILWTGTARVIRSQVKSVKERVYVKRARSLGAGNARLIFRHILPQVAPLLVANTVLTVAVAIFDETALSFLGLGDPNSVTWGSIIEHAFGRSAISAGAWWALVPAGICVAVLTIGCYLLGQAIEDALNPRLKVAHLTTRGFKFRPLVGRGSDAA